VSAELCTELRVELRVELRAELHEKLRVELRAELCEKLRVKLYIELYIELHVKLYIKLRVEPSYIRIFFGYIVAAKNWGLLNWLNWQFAVIRSNLHRLFMHMLTLFISL